MAGAVRGTNREWEYRGRSWNDSARTPQLILHQALQDDFLFSAIYLQLVWQSRGEFNDAVIEIGRPNLERVSHAHAIDFLKQVVRQIVALIEGEIAAQVTAARAAREFFRK